MRPLRFNPRRPLPPKVLAKLPSIPVRLPRRGWRGILRKGGISLKAIRLLARVRAGKSCSWLDLYARDFIELQFGGVFPPMDFNFVERREP